MYTIEDVIRYLQFYDEQGLKLSDVIEVLKHDANIPRISRQSQSVQHPQKV